MRSVVLLSLLLVAASAPRVAAEDCILIEDFAKAKVGEFPPGWKVRKDARASSSWPNQSPWRLIRRRRVRAGLTTASASRGVSARRLARERGSWRSAERPALRRARADPRRRARIARSSASAAGVYKIDPCTYLVVPVHQRH
jgi:hypothetical protein